MNVGNLFFCSRCGRSLAEEQVCPFCGYNPSSAADSAALEEGTMLCSLRYQIGAVKRKTSLGYLYGAYDYLRGCPTFICEYFPAGAAVRDAAHEDSVSIPDGGESEFEAGKKEFLWRGTHGEAAEHFTENGTLYLACPPDADA